MTDHPPTDQANTAYPPPSSYDPPPYDGRGYETRGYESAPPHYEAPHYAPAPPPQPALRPHPQVAGLLAHGREVLHDGEHIIDPVMAGFDHVMALAGYVLLFISVFMGLPALAAGFIAYIHRNDTHLLVRTHYKFQIRIFWTAFMLLVLALAAAIFGGTALLGGFVHFVQARFSSSISTTQSHALQGWVGGASLLAALVLWMLAAIWTMAASVVGFFRLVAEKPIGHLPVA